MFTVLTILTRILSLSHCLSLSLPLQGILTMQVVHSGYKDPNNLVFENITVLGVSAPPLSVSVVHNNNNTQLPAANFQYDTAKKVTHAHMLVSNSAHNDMFKL